MLGFGLAVWMAGLIVGLLFNAYIEHKMWPAGCGFLWVYHESRQMFIPMRLFLAAGEHMLEWWFLSETSIIILLVAVREPILQLLDIVGFLCGRNFLHALPEDIPVESIVCFARPAFGSTVVLCPEIHSMRMHDHNTDIGSGKCLISCQDWIFVDSSWCLMTTLSTFTFSLAHGDERLYHISYSAHHIHKGGWSIFCRMVIGEVLSLLWWKTQCPHCWVENHICGHCLMVFSTQTRTALLLQTTWSPN